MDRCAKIPRFFNDSKEIRLRFQSVVKISVAQKWHMMAQGSDQKDAICSTRETTVDGGVPRRLI
jgi:hypothetical protein